MNGRLIERHRLTAAQRAEMLRLLGRSFAGTDPQVFRRDLEEKSWVVLLERADGRLAGFSTLRFERTEYAGQPLSAVYSGDTVVDPGAGGRSTLSRTWIDAIRRLHRDHGVGRLYWLLIVSGYRTYRFLPVFAREFFPRHDRELPDDLRRLRDHLALARYGERYDPATGIVRLEQPQPLRAPLRGISPARQADPHVAFFARANPGHVDGDELVCLAEISDANLTPAAWRMIRAVAERRRRGTVPAKAACR